jgi:predicted pyridoxine 5'-phosphate oxidase superfamily flavin-nucleotide-binding protein
MLTNAWRPFYLKQRIQESEAIGIDREMAGMPTFRMPNAEIALARTRIPRQGHAEAARGAARIQDSIKAVTKMRFNEVGGLLLPSDVFEDEDGKPGTVRKWDFQIITSAGQRSIDPRTAARDYDRAIARDRADAVPAPGRPLRRLPRPLGRPVGHGQGR